MKNHKSILALAMAMVLCIGLMAGCSNKEKDPTGTTQKPGATTGTNKDENKPQSSKPAAGTTTPSTEAGKDENSQATTAPESSEPEENATTGTTTAPESGK